MQYTIRILVEENEQSPASMIEKLGFSVIPGRSGELIAAPVDLEESTDQEGEPELRPLRKVLQDIAASRRKAEKAERHCKIKDVPGIKRMIIFAETTPGWISAEHLQLANPDLMRPHYSIVEILPEGRWSVLDFEAYKRGHEGWLLGACEHLQEAEEMAFDHLIG